MATTSTNPAKAASQRPSKSAENAPRGLAATITSEFAKLHSEFKDLSDSVKEKKDPMPIVAAPVPPDAGIAELIAGTPIDVSSETTIDLSYFAWLMLTNRKFTLAIGVLGPVVAFLGMVTKAVALINSQAVSLAVGVGFIGVTAFLLCLTLHLWLSSRVTHTYNTGRVRRIGEPSLVVGQRDPRPNSSPAGNITRKEAVASYELTKTEVGFGGDLVRWVTLVERSTVLVVNETFLHELTTYTTFNKDLSLTLHRLDRCSLVINNTENSAHFESQTRMCNAIVVAQNVLLHRHNRLRPLLVTSGEVAGPNPLV